jgi:hypothetical protein
MLTGGNKKTKFVNCDLGLRMTFIGVDGLPVDADGSQTYLGIDCVHFLIDEIEHRRFSSVFVGPDKS